MRWTIKQFLICCFVLMFGSLAVVGQQDTGNSENAQTEQKKVEGYNFTIDVDLDRTDIKSQDRTGTCWSYATTSFIESELMRQGRGVHELSEMFVVRHTYELKARNYLLRQGKTNFSEGALSPDHLTAAQRWGLVPEEVYNGKVAGDTMHDHSEMVEILEGMVKQAADKRKASAKWWAAFNQILDVYMGTPPQEFSYQGQTFTPQSFAQKLGFNADDYLHFTSYTHHPFGRPFVLEIPDNFAGNSFQNIPLDELVALTDRALDLGYTIAWDGDVSEPSFLRDKGLAVLPTNNRSRDFARVPVEEIAVDQAMRQHTLENFSTTDDHLMHLVGRAFDSNGTKYYIIKNSWGKVGDHQGYLYMSEAYFKLKTVSLSVHKDVVNTTIQSPNN